MSSLYIQKLRIVHGLKFNLRWTAKVVKLEGNEYKQYLCHDAYNIEKSIDIILKF